jgi:hypothetical protein
MQLTDRNLEAILKAPALREEILAELLRQGAPNDILDKPKGKLDKYSLDLLHDVAYDALINSGLVVESYEAEQDKGADAVNIIGVPGAYYIEAPEYDDLGVFEKLEDARQALQDQYGEFLLP